MTSFDSSLSGMAARSISRRGLIAGAATLGVASLASRRSALAGDASSAKDALASASAAKGAFATSSCDVLVIGGGISGALAALSARAEGAAVTLVEKQSFIGGSAALSSGFMVTVNNDNFPEDIDDSWEKMASVLHGVHDQSPDTTYPTWDRLADVFGQQSATIDFMVDLGMKAEFGEKSTAVTMWDGKGAGMMDALAKAMGDKGVSVLLDSPAKELLVDDAGAVCGATIEGKDGARDIAAKKVILCCGGASHNEEILSSYIPTITSVDLDNQSAAGNTGDGFGMCEKLGAQFYPTMSLEEGGASVDAAWKNDTGFKASVNDKLIVDADGARFTNEAPAGSGSGQILAYYMVQHGSSKYFAIYGGTADEETKTALDKGVEAGCVFFGATPEELASTMGADSSTFVDTFAAYQEACEKGDDAEFGKDPERLVAYDTATGLYAVYIRPSSWGTIGGVVTDETGHVLTETGELVENLFAVGEMSNRELFSDFYVGGNSLALNSTMGRIAGATAVAEL